MAAVAAAALVGAMAGTAGANTAPATPPAPADADLTSVPAAPPPPGSTVDLAAGLTNVTQVEITGDAVYFMDVPRSTAAIYRRPMTTGPSGTALGDAEVVGISDGHFVEHDGTLAYLRHSDRRLVLRAPDGTLTTPAWWNPFGVGGVTALTDDWLVLSYAGDENQLRLVDREDGRTYTPEDLVDLPPGFPWPSTQGVMITDTRMLWVMTGYDSADVGWYAVYTVALGADGPQGEVVELAREPVDDVQDGADTRYFFPVDITGDRLMWQRYDYTGNPDEPWAITLQWYSGAPYTGTPATAALGDPVLAVEGDMLTLIRADYPEPATLEWVDLADPATPLRTVDARAFVFDVAGSFVAHAESGRAEAVLSDAAGGPVTVSATPVPTLEFSDVDWSDPFILEVQWMARQGVTTGYEDGTFRNAAPVNRDAMAAFLYRLAHGDANVPTCTEAPFADVPTSHPFCGVIAWLASTGITTGWPDGTFRPAGPVTRGAMAAFLYRFAHDGAHAPACTVPAFADIAVGDAFCGEIDWLADVGVTTGWPDHTFRPTASITRQAMAAFLFRFADAGLVPLPSG